MDLGNSRLKWAQHDAGVWRSDAVLLDGQQDIGALLDRIWRDMPAPRQIIVCSVTSPQRSHSLELWAQTHWSVKPHHVYPQAQQLGVNNHYRDPQQLGADRWAALIGARGLSDAATCIVDCGTAVTLEALSAEGDFLGGVILPGLRLQRQSLAHGTQGINVTDGDVTECPARSTADGVAAGTLYGLAGAVERLVEEYRRTLGAAMQLLLTGGDAPLLAPRLRVPHRVVPDLVLNGLARIADSLCK